MLQPYQNHSRSLPPVRADVSEGRVSSQERTLAALLDQAVRIKEEVTASLQSAQGSVQVEALSRRLMENHVRTITRIVKRLGADVQALESQIAQRDSVNCGTSFAVQSLDQKNLAEIGDLRGRVARCDASIAKLSVDVSSGEKQVTRLQQQVTDLRSALDVRLKEMELKVVGKLEASLSEQSQVKKSFMSDLHSQVNLLEARSSGGLTELKEETERLRRWTEQQLHRAQLTQTQGSQQLSSLLQNKMLEAESRIMERLCVLEARVERSEAHQDQADHSQADQRKRLETKLSGRISSLEKSLHQESGLRQELQLVKQDYHKGFKSIHDAIESLRQIGDTKSRLDKDKLQKDIRHIRRKMAELGDL
ncbi:protein FAM81B [Polymixia lowei]